MMRIVGVALAALIFAATVGQATAQTIKLGTLAPKGSPWYDILQDMTDAWSDASDGKLKVRIYPGGAIGDERDMVRKMGIGQLHGAMLTMEGLAMIVPEIQIFSLPLLLRTDEEVDYVLQQIGPDLEKLFEARGYKILNWGDAGWIQLFANVPVQHPDELRKLKLFSQAGADVFINAWRAQGFQPVPLPATDILPALQSGMIDSFFTTPVAALSLQWFGKAPHMTEIRTAKMVGATVLTMKAWKKIAVGARPGILAAADEAGQLSRDRIREFEIEAVEAMTEYGLEVHTLTPESQAEWEVVAKKSYEFYMRGYVSPELVARVERLRDEFRGR